jgi:sugar phosphate isomerase/epimerase
MNKSICFNYKYDSAYSERIQLIQECGFDGVFLYSQYNPVDYIDLIQNSTLMIESLHLPYKKIEHGKCVDSRYVNIIWNKGLAADEYVSDLIKEVRFASEYGIKTVVMHVTGGDDPPKINKNGLKNIERVLFECTKNNITLCLENLRRIDCLQYIFDNLKSDKLKFCFDSGHANYMTKNIDSFPWEYFGGYLYHLHLNDNDGENDQHLIPFEGNIKWKELMRKIKTYNQSIGLTLEVRGSKDMISTLSERDYLIRCYTSLIRLEKLMEEE